MWLILFIIGMVALASYFSPTPVPLKTLAVDIKWSATEIQLTNEDAEAVGKVVTVYVNGTPPSTFRAEATLPAVGRSVNLPLAGFVNREGDRFNPFAKAVTVIWVGGGGYDYSSFKAQ